MRKSKVEAKGLVSGILLPMGLICMFAFCSLALAVTGGTAYKNIQNNINTEYDSIVAANYLRTKLSQNNTSGMVEVVEIGETQVLIITSLDSSGAAYETRIYMEGDGLYESYGPASRAFSPGGGTRIATLQSCSFSIDEKGLFEAVIVSENGEHTRCAFALVGGGGA